MRTPKNWARSLSRALIDKKQLLQNGLVLEEELPILEQVKKNFDIRIPKVFLKNIKTTALAKQFVPSIKELIFLPEELEDPIGDERWTPVEGLTHRYVDRVLLKPTYLCASYCRFCFRRSQVSDPKNNLSVENFRKAIDYIKMNTQIWEVIFTGGDPFTLTNATLCNMLHAVDAIEHVQIIRFHTRIPSVLPDRVDEDLIKILKNLKKTLWIAVHINSAHEFTSECKKALATFRNAGIPLVLQSVLLKDINDSPQKLTALLKTAVQHGVKPYYLHYPDLAQGTHHFRIPLEKAIQLVQNLQGKISGLCLPHLIVDIPGGAGKISLNSHTAEKLENHTWKFTSPLDNSTIIVKYPSSSSGHF
jgi:lysine 2,3-aminomutase